MWATYQNTKRCYNYLESAAKLARILGYIPLNGIVDKKHGQRVVTEYGRHRRRADTTGVQAPTGVCVPAIPDPDERAEWKFDPRGNVVRGVRHRPTGRPTRQGAAFRPAEQAPYHVEVWSEKMLPDYLRGTDASSGLFERLDVNVVVEGEGDLSLTIAAELAERIEQAGKPAVIAYLSDFDPVGDNMATSLAAKVAWLKQRGDITQRVAIQQLGVTKEQIESLDLPRKPIEESEHTATTEATHITSDATLMHLGGLRG